VAQPEATPLILAAIQQQGDAMQQLGERLERAQTETLKSINHLTQTISAGFARQESGGGFIQTVKEGRNGATGLIVSSVIAVMAIMYGYTQPMQEHSKDSAARITALESIADANRSRLTQLEAAGRESETANQWISDVVNLEHQYVLVLQSILQQAASKGVYPDVPARDYWPLKMNAPITGRSETSEQ